jgi:hypothetical protein
LFACQYEVSHRPLLDLCLPISEHSPARDPTGRCRQLAILWCQGRVGSAAIREIHLYALLVAYLHWRPLEKFFLLLMHNYRYSRWYEDVQEGKATSNSSSGCRTEWN